MSYRDSEDHAKETGETLRTIRGMIRRLAVKLTDGVRWQLLGVRSPTGGDEVIDLEVFPGIGFYSRPPASGAPEAIANAIAGAPKARVVVATRDEKTRQAIVKALPGGALAEDETIVYSGAALIHIRANGTVEIRTPGGAAVPLATLADVQALRAWANTHVHTSAAAGNPTTVPTVLAAAPVGTTKLKGE